MVVTKTCSRCGKEKPLTIEFWKNAKNYKDGVRGQCRDCLNDLLREYRTRNIEKTRATGRKNHKNYCQGEMRLFIARKASLNKRAKECGLSDRVSIRDIADLFKRYPVCLCCGRDEFLEIDHVIPVSKGGRNTVDNLQILCRGCNAIKRDRIIDYRLSTTPKPLKPLALLGILVLP